SRSRSLASPERPRSSVRSPSRNGSFSATRSASSSSGRAASPSRGRRSGRWSSVSRRVVSSSSPSSGREQGCTRCTARGAERPSRMATAWWAERQSQARSRAILPFVLGSEIRAGSARRVELVLPRAGFPETERVEGALDRGLIRGPLVSLCQPEVAGRFEAIEVASRLGVTIPAAAGRGGTVALEGAVVDSEPVSRTRRDAAKGVVKPRVLPEDELPRAKRLAYLLQPPLETLLRAEGPIEWPHDLFPYQREGIRALVGST